MKYYKFPPELLPVALRLIAEAGDNPSLSHSDLPGAAAESIACLSYLFDTGLVAGKPLWSSGTEAGILALNSASLTYLGAGILAEKPLNYYVFHAGQSGPIFWFEFTGNPQTLTSNNRLFLSALTQLLQWDKTVTHVDICNNSNLRVGFVNLGELIYAPENVHFDDRRGYMAMC